MEFVQQTFTVSDGQKPREVQGTIALEIGLAYCKAIAGDFRVVHLASGKPLAAVFGEEHAQALITEFAEIAKRYQFHWSLSASAVDRVLSAHPNLKGELDAATEEKQRAYWDAHYGLEQGGQEEEVLQIPADTTEIQRVSTEDAQFLLTPHGLMYWPLPLDRDVESYINEHNETGYILPGEAIKLAKAILAREEEYQRTQQEMEAELLAVAGFVIDALGSKAEQMAGKEYWSTIRRETWNAYVALVVKEDENPVKSWYNASSSIYASIHQAEELMLQYLRKEFYKRYPEEREG